MKRQGFTLVEVLVSLGIMTIGAMALIGMQQQTTRANVRARDLTVGMQIAQNVIERLKIEALAWNNVTANPAADLTNAPLLAVINNNVAFRSIPARSSQLLGVTRNLSNAFDNFGDDVTLTGATPAQLASVRFCASYRLGWIFDNFRAMRADVRVWWTKEAPTRAILTDFPLCDDDNVKLNPGGEHYNDYHVVYLSTVLRPSTQ
jgi:prepilin-type N-terminal cleavage/methylation domain-containing protein